MTDKLKLFMFLIGCRPEGRHTEQHDVFFSVGVEPRAIVPELISFWPEAKGDLHIDAWREIRFVDGYEIRVVVKNDNTSIPADKDNKLFFINLGGYKAGEFEEFHYKMLAIGPDKGHAIDKAKKTAFFRHTGFKGAPSHVDDKFGVDVDDAHEIAEILSPALKNKYTLLISPAADDGFDELHLGYFKLDKL
jgi:hypothetical protein